MGVAGDCDLGFYGAMLAGLAGGLLSCLSYAKVQPLLERRGIHDTCGVNSLHGLPGILGAIVGIVVAPSAGFEGVGADSQTYALLTSLASALVFGLLAGFLMTQPLKRLGVAVPAAEL